MMKFEHILLVIFTILLLSTFSVTCKNSQKQKSYVKKENLICQIKNFTEDAWFFANSDDLFHNVLVYFEKKGDYYRVEMVFANPSSFNNLYAIVKVRNNQVYFYSETDLKDFIYSKKPWNIDTSNLVLEKHDWGWLNDPFRLTFYFNGDLFSNDSIFNSDDKPCLPPVWHDYVGRK